MGMCLIALSIRYRVPLHVGDDVRDAFAGVDDSAGERAVRDAVQRPGGGEREDGLNSNVEPLDVEGLEILAVCSRSSRGFSGGSICVCGHGHEGAEILRTRSIGNDQELDGRCAHWRSCGWGNAPGGSNGSQVPHEGTPRSSAPNTSPCSPSSVSGREGWVSPHSQVSGRWRRPHHR